MKKNNSADFSRRFSRQRFLDAEDHASVSAALAIDIETRLRGATQPHVALEWVVADLRRCGHNVAAYDGVIANWLDQTEDPYLWIVVGDLDRDDNIDVDGNGAVVAITVYVAWRPQLPERKAQLGYCLRCGHGLTSQHMRLDIQGHGSVNAPSVHVRFDCPGLSSIDGPVGIASIARQLAVLVCGGCNVAFFKTAR